MATIAVAPLIRVPAAINMARLIGTFNFSLKNITAIIDVMMHNVIIGSPSKPTSKISLSPSFIPKNTIPNFKFVFKIKSNPCVKVSEIHTRLLIVINYFDF